MRLGLAVGLLSGLLSMACMTQTDLAPQNMDRFDSFDRGGLDAADAFEAPPRVDVRDEAPQDVADPDVADDAPKHVAAPDLIDGAISSALSGLPNVDGAATSLSVYEDSGWVDFEILRSEADAAVMALGYLDGSFDNRVFTEVGRVTRFVHGNPVGENPEQIYLDISACAGNNPYEWDIDEPADEVVVEVEEGEEPGDVVVVLHTEGQSGELEVRMLLSR